MAKRKLPGTARQRSAKISKVTQEEKAKPKGKRRSRKAIIGKALGILRHKQGKRRR